MNTKYACIKAAVEHRILRIKYQSKKKAETTYREVEADFIGYKGSQRGYWADDCLRKTRLRFFIPSNILEWKVTNKNFDPSHNAS
ncbi:MAG: hypothetical protein ACFFC7_24765 [Candidatus Hermodarchaeota archaeon]